MNYQRWILLLLFLTTISTSFFLFQYRKNIKIIQQKHQSAINRVSNDLTIETDLQKETILNENKKLNFSGFIDKNNTPITLKNLLASEKKILVFAIPDGMCQVCYDDTFAAYENFAINAGVEKTFVLCSKKRLREVTTLLQGKNIKILAFTTEDGLISPFQGYTPFFFVLDSDVTAKNIFFPRKGGNGSTPSLAKFYLENVGLTAER